MIFINRELCDSEDFYLNQEWELTKLFEKNTLYTISVKDNKLNWLLKTYEKQKYAKREYNNLIKTKNISGVPKILAANISEPFSYLIISKEPGLDLFEYMKQNGPLSEDEIISIAKKMLKILKHIHSLGIIHKDIKPENIIYDSVAEKITLIDFEGKETPVFSSPEQIKKEFLTGKTDIWSLGITLLYLLTGILPKKNKFIIPKKFEDFFSLMLEEDADIRYDAEDMLDFLRNFKKNKNK